MALKWVSRRSPTQLARWGAPGIVLPLSAAAGWLVTSRATPMLLLLAVAASLMMVVSVWMVTRRPQWYAVVLITGLVTLQETMQAFLFLRPRQSLIFGGLGLLAVFFLVLRHSRIWRAWLLWPYVVYVGYFSPSILVALAEGGRPHLWIQWVAVPAIFYLFTVQACSSVDRARSIRRLVILLALGQALLSLGALFSTRGIGWIAQAVAERHFAVDTQRFYIWAKIGQGTLHRSVYNWGDLFVNGTFAHPNRLGGFLAFVVPQVLWARQFELSQTWRRLMSVGLVVLSVAIFFTFSRGAWLALILSMLISFTSATSHRRTVLGLLVTILIAVLVFPTIFQLMLLRLGQMGAIADRASILRVALMLWERSPLIGTGLGTFNRLAAPFGHAINPHNDYLLYFVEGGLLGFLAYMAPFVVLGVFTVKEWTRSQPGWQRSLAASGLATLTAFIVFSATNPSQYLTVFLAILAAAWESELRLVSHRESVKAMVEGHADAEG